jgi:hypothetical protein
VYLFHARLRKPAASLLGFQPKKCSSPLFPLSAAQTLRSMSTSHLGAGRTAESQYLPFVFGARTRGGQKEAFTISNQEQGREANTHSAPLVAQAVVGAWLRAGLRAWLVCQEASTSAEISKPTRRWSFPKSGLCERVCAEVFCLSWLRFWIYVRASLICVTTYMTECTNNSKWGKRENAKESTQDTRRSTHDRMNEQLKMGKMGKCQGIDTGH